MRNRGVDSYFTTPRCSHTRTPFRHATSSAPSSPARAQDIQKRWSQARRVLGVDLNCDRLSIICAIQSGCVACLFVARHFRSMERSLEIKAITAFIQIPAVTSLRPTDQPRFIPAAPKLNPARKWRRAWKMSSFLSLSCWPPLGRLSILPRRNAVGSDKVSFFLLYMDLECQF